MSLRIISLAAIFISLLLGCSETTNPAGSFPNESQSTDDDSTDPDGSDSDKKDSPEVVYDEHTVQNYDFQPDNAKLQDGFIMVDQFTEYDPDSGFGFTVLPTDAVDGSRKVYKYDWNKPVDIDEAIPASVLSDASVDCVKSASPFSFRTDVLPGDYDITIWLGDVAAATHRIRVTANDVEFDVERMDINHRRGILWGNENGHIEMGNAVPRSIRVSAPEGAIEIRVEAQPGSNTDILYSYSADQCKSGPQPTKESVRVPAFSSAGLQAVNIHPAIDTPFSGGPGNLQIQNTPIATEITDAVAAFNSGDMAAAELAATNLTASNQRFARAALLFRIAGHPAQLQNERTLLAQAEELLAEVWQAEPFNFAAKDMLLAVRMSDDAEYYRQIRGYAAVAGQASENLGRSCSIVEQYQPDHPYYWKGKILYVRNRGGLDPNRCTISWEYAQDLAGQMDAQWGSVNPFVHVYATDEWEESPNVWPVIDWADIAGDGPQWARTLMSGLNTQIDLFEWWIVNRQSEEDFDIGGGWTDDVEIIPAFGLMAYVLRNMSSVLEHGTIRFVDELWENSGYVDPDAGYQPQYADVEHTAEPTGNSLQMYPMLAYGDPEGVERMLKLARTFETLFLEEDDGSGHRHFKGNHMSSTKIATNPDHEYDIPLNGRAVGPLPWIVWYSSNPGVENSLLDWATAWAEDAAMTSGGKPAGIFPNIVDVGASEMSGAHIGTPTGSWWNKDNPHGQYSALPNYHDYLYNLSAFMYVRTGDSLFLEPFDHLQDYTAAWTAAGSPSYTGAPPAGQESLWAAAKLKNTAAATAFDLANHIQTNDWDNLLSAAGSPYSKFISSGARSATAFINDIQSKQQETLQRWPYRTTEGVMTDRILQPGWFSLIPFYIGADMVNVYHGLPLHAVTWSGTGRLFAAIVTKSSITDVAASTYLFNDNGREVGVSLWNLEEGAQYRLEAGPAADVGMPPSSIAETVNFTFSERGQTIPFYLPGRTVFGIRVTRTSPSAGTPTLRPDVALSHRDVRWDANMNMITVSVHNVGSASASNIKVEVREGGLAGTVIGTKTIPSLDAPIDMTAPLSSLLKIKDVTFSYSPTSLPAEVTIIIDPDDALNEVTKLNNSFTAVIGGDETYYLPPMIEKFSTPAVTPGDSIEIVGKNFQVTSELLVWEAESSQFELTFIDEQTLSLEAKASAPSGYHPISIINSDGKTSNLHPLLVQ